MTVERKSPRPLQTALQGVVAEGALDASGVFKADTVLAKHDETYMPKLVSESLKAQGDWRGDGAPGRYAP